ncbi:MAG: hypothetical protein Q9M29_07685, partial [Mariprofundaceae bacterium]|nr:hypothetical protein [Mariprofundaceae bacterium]
LPDGRGDAVVFAQLYRPGYMYIDNLGLRAQAAVRELKTMFADLSYAMQELPLLGTSCKRIDFTGKVRNMFMAPVQGYDIHCLVHRKEGQQTMAVRIGGNLVTNPEYPAPDTLPDEVEAFAGRVSFQK